MPCEERERAEIRFEQLTRPYSFKSPFSGREFALLLVIADEHVPADEQDALSEQVVREGCRYAVCFGHDCSSWDDSIDWVGITDEVDGRPSPLVMTTWHERQSLAEVVDFFADCTEIEGRPPERFAALLVGGEKPYAREVRAAIGARFVVRTA